MGLIIGSARKLAGASGPECDQLNGCPYWLSCFASRPPPPQRYTPTPAGYGVLAGWHGWRAGAPAAARGRSRKPPPQTQSKAAGAVRAGGSVV